MGSMFLGDKSQVFYVYEPLDPLYSAMYGAAEGWTVPSDIFNGKNGSLRYARRFDFKDFFLNGCLIFWSENVHKKLASFLAKKVGNEIKLHFGPRSRYLTSEVDFILK